MSHKAKKATQACELSVNTVQKIRELVLQMKEEKILQGEILGRIEYNLEFLEEHLRFVTKTLREL